MNVTELPSGLLVVEMPEPTAPSPISPGGRLEVRRAAWAGELTTEGRPANRWTCPGCGLERLGCEYAGGVWVTDAAGSREHVGVCDWCADPAHSMPIRVTILDTATGRTAQDEYDFGTYWWTEGNGSCDCNREDLFGNDDGTDGVCMGEKRYRVVAVEPLLDGYTLADFNRGYPDACPKCQSPDVAVGNFVLRCLACGWHYLNGFPCRVCGGPATGVMGGGGETLYSCRAHPFTDAEMRAAFSRLAQAVAPPTHCERCGRADCLERSGTLRAEGEWLCHDCEGTARMEE